MSSKRLWWTVALWAVAVALILMFWTGRKAERNAGKKEAPQEARLIESLRGADLFQAYCASCHGPDGKGGGPTAMALKVAVPDLTLIRQRGGGSFPTARIEKILSGETGIAAHGSREMPVWGPIFQRIAWDQDLGRVRIHNLTKYLESLQQR